MINDGVCDELTNVERCLFDGGDCCLVNKTKSMCSVCTCKQKVNSGELASAFDKYQVRLVGYPEDYLQSVSSEVKAVEDVESEDVCSVLCLEKELEDQVNSWLFYHDSRNCTCSWLETHFCDYETLLFHPIDESSSMPWTEMSFFVQMRKTIPCGETIALNT